MNVGCAQLAPWLHLLYPTRAAPRAIAFGPYELEAAVDAPIAAESMPLAVISHGTGGTPWSYRGLACFLAARGVAVAMIAHPGNTRGDNALDGTPANLANRPRHVKDAIDLACAHAPLAPRVAVIGHSLGGYTALAVAGGAPMALPNQTPDGRAVPIDVVHDPRVDRIALLAPAVPWLMAPGALDGVRARIYARTGAQDDIAPPAFVERVLAPLRARCDYAVVPGAGHFAWITPVPPALASPGFPPAHDPPGFDRAAYQRVLHDELLAFVTSLPT